MVLYHLPVVLLRKRIHVIRAGLDLQRDFASFLIVVNIKTSSLIMHKSLPKEFFIIPESLLSSCEKKFRFETLNSMSFHSPCLL